MCLKINMLQQLNNLRKHWNIHQTMNKYCHTLRNTKAWLVAVCAVGAVLTKNTKNQSE